MRQVGISTAFAGPNQRSILSVIDLVERVGARAVVLDGQLGADRQRALGRELRGRDLPIWAIEQATGDRAPALASRDREETDAAMREIGRLLTTAAELGAGQVIVGLGAVAELQRDWPAVRRAYLRAELDETQRAELMRRRTLLGGRYLDAVRRALDRLLPVADSSGLSIGLRNPGRPFGLPAPMELAELLRDFSGGPLVPLLDLRAAHLDEVMGFRSVTELVATWRSSPLVLVADACGPVVGLPPGRGEIDVAAALREVPKARWVFYPVPSLSPDELRLGMDWLASQPSRPTSR